MWVIRLVVLTPHRLVSRQWKRSPTVEIIVWGCTIPQKPTFIYFLQSHPFFSESSVSSSESSIYLFFVKPQLLTISCSQVGKGQGFLSKYTYAIVFCSYLRFQAFLYISMKLYVHAIAHSVGNELAFKLLTLLHTPLVRRTLTKCGTMRLWVAEALRPTSSGPLNSSA